MGAKQGYSAPLFKVKSLNASYNVAAALGLSGEEAVEKLGEALVEGVPPEAILRLFREGRGVCLLPRSVAEAVGVEVATR